MKPDIDSLPALSPRQAYLAMYEFLNREFETCEEDGTIHLGGLLSEMEPMANGTTGDPGAAETFVKAVQSVISTDYRSPW